jgi:hypothetical protein
MVDRLIDSYSELITHDTSPIEFIFHLLFTVAVIIMRDLAG